MIPSSAFGIKDNMNKPWRFELLVLLISLLTYNAEGQQIPLYTQYMMNSFLINPAVAGNDGLTSFNLTAREQWLGFENAPRTVAVSAQTRLLKTSFINRGRTVRRRPTSRSRSGNVGLGGYIFNDRNGVIDRTGFQGSYSYHVWTQQMPMYSQYMMNRFLLNPAVAGYDGLTTVNLTAREQWMGLPYSPRTVA
jgi:hypothetical protein